jgi:3-isopropylmalate/(R)-2-methylmalate dehydratase small subunit
MNWMFENNINTDLITPGRYNITTDAKELAKVTFIEYRPEFSKQVKKGDFVVAGNNFGCGSSRETAVTALKHCGVSAVIAQSFARIFYRNAMNQGLLALVADTSKIMESDKLELDFERKVINNISQNTRIPFEMPNTLLRLHQADGIINYIKQHGLNSIGELFTGEDK